MHGLTRAEMEHNERYNPVDVMFNLTETKFGQSLWARNDYLEVIVSGRFPVAVEFLECK